MRNQKGYTLTELMIVIAIVGVVVGVIVCGFLCPANFWCTNQGVLVALQMQNPYVKSVGIERHVIAYTIVYVDVGRSKLLRYTLDTNLLFNYRFGDPEYYDPGSRI